MDVRSIIETARTTPNCVVHPAERLPTIEEGHILPDDLRMFYDLCGGLELFQNAGFPISISAPQRLVPANPVILVGLTQEHLTDPEYDFSRSWYIIGWSNSGNYITIDLGVDHLGYCYDSFWDVHPFNSTVMAKSFTNLLVKLLATKGDYWRDSPSLQSSENIYLDLKGFA